jgi:hypothetical protein
MSTQQDSAAVGRQALAGNTDTSLLKIIALIFMVVDHVSIAFPPQIRELRMLGRIAMPLYVWCLVVGSEYTHDALKYALRLLILGVISQPLYMMALGATWTELNILFLLCLGVLAIAGIREKWYYSQFWAPALCLLFTLLVDVDYGWKGFLFILFLYACRKSKGSLAAAFLASAVIWGYASYPVTSFLGWKFSFLTGNVLSPVLQLFFQMQSVMWLALPLILIQTHSRIRIPKWLGYGLYPLHLLVFVLIGLLTGTPMDWFINALKAV